MISANHPTPKAQHLVSNVFVASAFQNYVLFSQFVAVVFVCQRYSRASKGCSSRGPGQVGFLAKGSRHCVFLGLEVTDASHWQAGEALGFCCQSPQCNASTTRHPRVAGVLPLFSIFLARWHTYVHQGDALALFSSWRWPSTPGVHVSFNRKERHESSFCQDSKRSQFSGLPECCKEPQIETAKPAKSS